MEYKNHKITEAVCAFRFNPSDANIFSVSKKIFGHSSPISGDAKRALDLAIIKAGKRFPTLSNRL